MSVMFNYDANDILDSLSDRASLTASELVGNVGIWDGD